MVKSVITMTVALAVDEKEAKTLAMYSLVDTWRILAHSTFRPQNNIVMMIMKRYLLASSF